MAIVRSILLAASQNAWMRERASKYEFVRRSVSRFMPGENLEDALAAAHSLENKKIGSVFTNLGENVKDPTEAAQVTAHYLGVLDCIHRQNLGTEISVKLTQLGLDLSKENCFENLKKIIEREKRERIVWVDMESSQYVDATLELYRRALAVYPNVGICLQAYLYRTKDDLGSMLPLRPSVRLVKGAYQEPASVAFPRKGDVDERYFRLAQTMLKALSAKQMVRAAFGTHDVPLIRRLTGFLEQEGIAKSELEVQMLYGIQRQEQERLAADGCRSIVLVAYGNYWYPWFMRRLAERPANLWFMMRNLFAG
jgi:proline dehydrogenase